MDQACEQELLAAYERNDFARLSALYEARAREVETSDIDAACFYMVNAYVYALELGSDAHEEPFAFLVKYQREQPHL